MMSGLIPFITASSFAAYDTTKIIDDSIILNLRKKKKKEKPL
jgi:hypothetical protein